MFQAEECGLAERSPPFDTFFGRDSSLYTIT
jgi:hypothetical protein